MVDLNPNMIFDFRYDVCPTDRYNQFDVSDTTNEMFFVINGRNT